MKGGCTMRFILVGGSPFKSYTGTVSYTGLREVGRYTTKEQADTAFQDHYDECGGLLLIVEASDDTAENPDDSDFNDSGCILCGKYAMDIVPVDGGIACPGCAKTMGYCEEGNEE